MFGDLDRPVNASQLSMLFLSKVEENEVRWWSQALQSDFENKIIFTVANAGA